MLQDSTKKRHPTINRDYVVHECIIAPDKGHRFYPPLARSTRISEASSHAVPSLNRQSLAGEKLMYLTGSDISSTSRSKDLEESNAPGKTR